MISYNISKKTKIERTALIIRRLLYILSAIILLTFTYFSLAFFGSDTWVTKTNETVEMIAPNWIKAILGWIKEVDKTTLFWIWFSILIISLLIIVGICVAHYYTTYDTPYSQKVTAKKLQKLKYKELKIKRKLNK